MFIRCKYTAAYGMCPVQHYNFDFLHNVADKAMIADHIANTDGLYFNKNDVRTLAYNNHKRKLVDELPPGQRFN